MTKDDTYQSHVVTTTPDLPVTLQTAREHLRMDELTVEDNLIRSYIMAATRRIEKEYGMLILTQTVKQYHSGFPDSGMYMLLRLAPGIAVSSIKYIDSEGAEQTWSSDEYSEAIGPGGRCVFPGVGFSYPSGVAEQPDAVTITYTAGFGTAPTSVPDDIQLAILHLMAEMHARRDNPTVSMPQIVDLLMHPYWRPKA